MNRTMDVIQFNAPHRWKRFASIPAKKPIDHAAFGVGAAHLFTVYQLC